MCKPRQCLECQACIQAHDKRADFCGTACRKTWNNRRMIRGAELYDLFMALRFERGAAKALGIWSLLCRMASWWGQEDRAAGRRTYGDPKRAIERAVRYTGVRMS